jgi:hypothetical protein
MVATMNAWIDCLTYLRDGDGVSRFHLGPDEPLVVEILDVAMFKKRAPEVFDALELCDVTGGSAGSDPGARVDSHVRERDRHRQRRGRRRRIGLGLSPADPRPTEGRHAWTSPPFLFGGNSILKIFKQFDEVAGNAPQMLKDHLPMICELLASGPRSQLDQLQREMNMSEFRVHVIGKIECVTETREPTERAHPPEADPKANAVHFVHVKMAIRCPLAIHRPPHHV